jgi:hypothetical protein
MFRYCNSMKTIDYTIIWICNMILGIVLLIASCTKHELRTKPSRPVQTVPAQVDYSAMPRTDQMKAIDSVIGDAVRSKWTKEEWMKRFGEPRRVDKYDGGYEFIQYYDSGPFVDCSKTLVTGIIIKLQNNNTFGFSYQTTSFGLPEGIDP